MLNTLNTSYLQASRPDTDDQKISFKKIKGGSNLILNPYYNDKDIKKVIVVAHGAGISMGKLKKQRTKENSISVKKQYLTEDNATEIVPLLGGGISLYNLKELHCLLQREPVDIVWQSTKSTLRSGKSLEKRVDETLTDIMQKGYKDIAVVGFSAGNKTVAEYERNKQLQNSENSNLTHAVYVSPVNKASDYLEGCAKNIEGIMNKVFSATAFLAKKLPKANNLYTLNGYPDGIIENDTQQTKRTLIYHQDDPFIDNQGVCNKVKASVNIPFSPRNVRIITNLEDAQNVHVSTLEDSVKIYIKQGLGLNNTSIVSEQQEIQRSENGYCSDNSEEIIFDAGKKTEPLSPSQSLDAPSMMGSDISNEYDDYKQNNVKEWLDDKSFKTCKSSSISSNSSFKTCKSSSISSNSSFKTYKSSSISSNSS